MSNVSSTCAHSMCIGGVCAECGERMEQREKPKKTNMKMSASSSLPCSHPMRMGSLCTHCGATILSEDTDIDNSLVSAPTSKITVQGGSTMHMTKAGAALYQADKSARLIREKRLSLVLDIDHTLLHATDDPTASEYPGTDTRSFFLRNCGRIHYIKLRPNLLQFLKEASKLFELTLYTHGTREYAEAVAKSLDREGKLFQRRIVSACDTVELSQRGAKCLSRIFPCGTDMALIVDDRFDVWSDKGQEQNLLLVRPYHFWGVSRNSTYFDPGVSFNKVPSAGTCGWAVYGMRSIKQHSGGDESTVENEEERQYDGQELLDNKSENRNHHNKEGSVQKQKREGEFEEVTRSGKRTKHDNRDNLEDNQRKQNTAICVEENDPQLFRILQVTMDIQKRYYSCSRNDNKQPPEQLSVGSILRNLLKDILRGVCIVFSGIIPLKPPSAPTGSTSTNHQNERKLKKDYFSLTTRAEMMGASVVSRVGPGVTHVVSARIDTEKAAKGLRTEGCCVVHVDWLLFCIWHMRREREEPFLLSRNVQIADNNLKQENSFDKYSALAEIEEHCDSKVAQPLCRSVSGDSSSSLDSDLADFAKEIDDDLQQ